MKLEPLLGYEEKQMLRENTSSEENSRVVAWGNPNHSVKISA